VYTSTWRMLGVTGTSCTAMTCMRASGEDPSSSGMRRTVRGYRRDMTTVTLEMLRDSPVDVSFDEATLARCIDECLACAQACTACADACLAEDSVEQLRRCITTDLDCADLCATTARVLSRQTDPHPAMLRIVLEACMNACRECAEECEVHADHHEHCRLCAEACRRCAKACQDLLDELIAA